MGSVATLEQQEVAVNSIKLFEGVGQGAIQVKADATINASITRKAQQGTKLVKDGDQLVRTPTRSTLTRADVWQTILAATMNHYGLQLNTDGKT